MLIVQPGLLMTEREALALLLQLRCLTWQKFQRLSQGLLQFPEDNSIVEQVLLLQHRPPTDILQ